MAESDFGKAITQAARQVARIEQKRRQFRKHLAELDREYHDAQVALRLLVQSVEPYTPPSADETRAAAADARERE